MKMILRIVLIIAIVALAGTAFAAVDQTVSTRATATKVEDFDATGAVLDNFNDNGRSNLWWGETGAFGDASGGGTCSASNDSTSPSEGAYCLKLNYNVTAAASYAGYYSKMQSKDLSAYTSISFWVKGASASGGEFFKLELKNNNDILYWDERELTHYHRNTAAVYITDFLDGGVTASWQKVTIPFHNFANLSMWNSMSEFVLVFENSQNGLNGTPQQGAIYIDDISFGNAPQDAVRIDHFGDRLGLSSLGGMVEHGGDGGTAEHFFSSEPAVFHNYSKGLKFNYNVTANGSYAYTYFIFGGGNDAVEKPEKAGWIKVPQDFSGYNYISFWIRAESLASNPRGIKVELHDFSGIGNGEPFCKIQWDGSDPIATFWKKYKIPLTEFKDWSNVPLDKSRISELVFTIENGNAYNKSGIVYIDEVQFERSAGAVSAVGISPAEGSSVHNEEALFTATYSDSTGWQNLRRVHFFLKPPDGSPITSFDVFDANFYYDAWANRLYWHDVAHPFQTQPGFTPGTDSIIETNSVILNCRSTTVSASGNNLQITWAVTFKDAFPVGTYNCYLSAANSEYDYINVQKGTWTVKRP